MVQILRALLLWEGATWLQLSIMSKSALCLAPKGPKQCIFVMHGEQGHVFPPIARFTPWVCPTTELYASSPNSLSLFYYMNLGGLASTCWHANLALGSLATTWLTWLSRNWRDIALHLNIPSVALLKEFLPEGVSVAMYYCLHWEQVTYLFHYLDATNCHLTERWDTECLWSMILPKVEFFLFL